jgi:2-polyprenyl-3-methyl-5-hydroxy-6-metoxy-1,4-benzoquinol methylase
MSTSCPNCGGAPVPKPLLGDPLKVLRCGECRQAFLEAWSTDFDAEMYDYYSARLNWPKARVHPRVNEPRLGEILASLSSECVGRRMLDVGCGAGQWVHFADTHGWSARGIDLSTSAVAVARAQGAPAEHLDFFSPDLDGLRFDAITMWELIEHVANAGAFFDRAADLLAPHGTLVVSTPNFAGLGRRWLGQRWPALDRQHLLYFEPTTLRERLESRFAEVRMESRGLYVPTRRSASGIKSAPRQAQAAARAQVAGSPALRAVKRLADATLRRALVGETLVAWARRPR